MGKIILKILGIIILTAILILLIEIFYPRSYDVPVFQKRSGIRYWDLPDGSRIGYTFIPAKEPVKSYPVIYLHGGPGGCITNNDINVLQGIADSGYNVFLYDQTGSGQSDRLADISQYTVQRHIEDLKEIIGNLNTQKVILIGHSWGGILAALFAVDNPDKIAKIIFTCPGPVFPVRRNLATIRPPDSIHLRKPRYTNAQGNKKASNIRTRAMAFFATKFGKKIASDREADEFATYLNYEVNKSGVCDTANILKQEPGRGYYAAVMTYKSLLQIKDPRPKIRQLSMPVLVMKGECDNQPWGYTNEYLELFKNSELKIIPGAGHFISVEQPQAWLKNIVGFLNQ